MTREKIFRFKQFGVLNDKTAMKVGTDGVLLGAWCDVAGARRVLDVGTGCGLIALMVAQRNKGAAVTAIDIDDEAVGEARINIARSPWSDRVEALCVDFNDFAAQEPYDLIVSNPPFFTEDVMAAHDGAADRQFKTVACSWRPAGFHCACPAGVKHQELCAESCYVDKSPGTGGAGGGCSPNAAAV